MNEIVVNSDYEPSSNSAKRLHASTARVIVCVGGLGSGKSYAVVKEMEMSACQWPGMPIAVFRKTLPALRDSTLHEFRESVDEELGDWKERDVKWTFKNDSFINFRGLDDPTKAKSTQYGLVILEEAEEFTIEDFRRLNERVRKMGPWPLRIILILNPVDETHWIYNQFVENAAIWQEAGGLEVIHFSTYDNVQNLPPGYIAQVTAGMSPEEIDRYIHGNWGTIVKGTPVYAGILNPDIHLREFKLTSGHQLIRGWDFGFNHPAVSFRVVDQFGRMNCRFSKLGTKIDLEVFVPEIIQLTNLLFPTAGIISDFGDPRGHDKSPAGKESCFDVLQDFGITAIGERMSREYVDKGIRQIKREFSSLIQGIPQLTIDPNNSLLRAAYFGKYVNGDDGKPVKDGYYEHVCEADRYISHHRSHQDAVQSAIEKQKRRIARKRSTAKRYTGYVRGR